MTPQRVAEIKKIANCVHFLNGELNGKDETKGAILELLDEITPKFPWREQDGYWALSVKTKIYGTYFCTCLITIESRPTYCDRGRCIVKIHGLYLDDQEGFPRYFFDLDRAKLEMEAWLIKRAEVIKVSHVPIFL